MSGPFHDELGCDVVHIIEHAANHEGTECGYQDAVGDGPVLFALVSREETIMGAIADFLKASSDGLREAILVANLVHQFMRAEENAGVTKSGEAIDGAWGNEERRGEVSIARMNLCGWMEVKIP